MILRLAPLASLLVLLIFFSNKCLASDLDAHMEIIDGEFVIAHVGNPGADVAFRIRWDLPYVGLFYTSGVLGNSHSASPSDQSDLFCFGSVCQRLKYVVLAQDPPPTGMFVNSDSNAVGHTGVLGLAPGSPVYGIYPWVRYSAYELGLFVHYPGNSTWLSHHRSFGSSAEVLANGWADTLDIDLSIDYNVFNGATYRNQTHVHIRVLGSLEFTVNMHDTHMHTSDGSRVSAVAYSPYAGITIGRSLAAVLFSCLVGPSGAIISISPIADSVPVTSRLDYLLYTVPVLILLVFWMLGIGEDVLDSQSFSQPSGGYHMVSLQNPAFAQDFYLMCEIVLGVVIVTLFYGIGMGRLELVTSSRRYTDAVAYSCLAVVILTAAAAGATTFVRQQAVVYGSCAFYVSAWLLFKMESGSAVVRILMLLLATQAQVMLHFGMFDSLLGMRHRQYDTLSGRSKLRSVDTALGIIFSLVMSAWGAWFCSFSVIPATIRAWRPGHPFLMQIAVVMCTILLLFAYTMFYSRRLQLLKYKLLQITLDHALNERNAALSEQQEKAPQQLMF